MGQKEKLIKKLKSVPKDMTFEEVETLLRYLTYLRSNKGKDIVFESPVNIVSVVF